MNTDIDVQQLLNDKDRQIANLEARLRLSDVLIQTLDRQLQEAMDLCDGPNPVEDFQAQVEEIVASAEGGR